MQNEDGRAARDCTAAPDIAVMVNLAYQRKMRDR